MIEVANVRSPGWQRVVAELSAPLGDDRVFLLRMLSTLGVVSNAKQAVLFLPQVAGGGEQPQGLEVRPAQSWPFGAALVDESGKLSMTPADAMDPAKFDAQGIERAKDAAGAARACAASRSVQVFALDEDTQFYQGESSGKWYVVAVPIMAGLPQEAPTLPPRAVVTLLVESRSRAALQSVAAMVEVLAGYAFTHEAQQALRRTKQGAAALELAGRLIAAMNATSGFKGASVQLVNDLSRQLAVDRVALGWVPGSPARWPGRRTPDDQGARGVAQQAHRVHLRALSDTEHIDRRLEMCRKFEDAFEECLDQEQPLLYPSPPAAGPGSDPVLAQGITHAHRELAKGDASVKVASFPLRVVDTRGERISGVLSVEAGREQTLDPALVELVQATLDLVAPVLAVRASDDRNLALRAWDSALRGAAWFVGPRHTVWKVAGIALMVLTGVLFFGGTTYRVGAPMSLKAQTQRVIAAPLNGVIERIPEGVRSGASVKAGDLLVQMDTKELSAQLLEAQAQLVQYEKASDDALRKGNTAEAMQSRARADQSQARIDLLALQMERSSVRSPIDGTIISPDVTERVGSTVKLGEVLFQVADLSSMKVVARVDDRDISYVQIGQTGQISPKADPSRTVDFVVEQIVPLSQASEGANAFEVRGRFAEGVTKENWFLPGLEGQAKFNTERKSFAWILSRRIVDQFRTWLWW